MKFTLSEWDSIRRALGTALVEEESFIVNLEAEVKTNPAIIKDYLDGKIRVAELQSFISRIENATI